MTAKTNATEKPITKFKSQLFYLERAHEELSKAKGDLEREITKAINSFDAARDAAKGFGKEIPERFMSGQWLFDFGKNGELNVTEIQNCEPYQLLELARSMGEEDPV
ncbi:hypothetical protein PSCICO_15240 [Pseudomonas cichorii]|uniref:hypothetical protein n=1 Tax=Pseudomonas cichorii TaxID=36746 RepID=UPI0019105D3A|nr:hypothetical protein [Pseudomonas cichorii]GFM86125.1 hypothetical protein PSCICO_15240 [Pseudomonas cichorii]